MGPVAGGVGHRTGSPKRREGDPAKDTLHPNFLEQSFRALGCIGQEEGPAQVVGKRGPSNMCGRRPDRRAQEPVTLAASRRNHVVPVRAAPTLALPRSYAERASENPPSAKFREFHFHALG
jgi:hypothetical protein